MVAHCWEKRSVGKLASLLRRNDMNASFRLYPRRLLILNSISVLAVGATSFLPLGILAQVNSGSDGHDGALSTGFGGGPLVIDMADHPDGIYHYTSVNIGPGQNVVFIPNAGRTPIVWLVQ